MATIVIVDHSASIRMNVKQALEGAGYKVIEGENGNDGLEKILKLQTPDLVISDYKMPGLDGVVMLAKVKEKLGPSKFPIFMLTTEANDKLKAAGLAVGVLAWINKPFAPDKLVSAIDKVLGPKKKLAA
jgi:two-component system chemotaxis response regulator CheY